MTINEKIRQLRTSAGITQRELAEKTGLSAVQMSRIEGGHCKNLDTLNRILALFGHEIAAVPNVLAWCIANSDGKITFEETVSEGAS